MLRRFGAQKTLALALWKEGDGISRRKQGRPGKRFSNLALSFS